MNLIRLERLVSEIGHPRGHLLKYMGDKDSESVDCLRVPAVHERKVMDEINKLDEVPRNSYIVYQEGNNEVGIFRETLLRIKDNEAKLVGNYARRHVVSSAIKHFIVEDDSFIKRVADESGEDVNSIKIHSILYLYYYFSIFSMWIPTSEKERTTILEGVCILLSETISTLLAKERTLYANIDIDPIVDILQLRLRLERLSLSSSGPERVLNLREFL